MAIVVVEAYLGTRLLFTLPSLSITVYACVWYLKDMSIGKKMGYCSWLGIALRAQLLKKDARLLHLY